MKLVLELFTPDHVPAASRFNQRLRAAHGDPAFELPEESTQQSAAPFRLRQWVLTDGDEIRGGVLLQELTLRIGTELHAGANMQTPISEGIFSPGFAHLGVMLLKQIQAKYPLLYAVGMGSLDRPLPKLLQALRWRIKPAPFFFHAGRGSRMFRELAPFRKSEPLRVAGFAASQSGLGGPILRAAQAAAGWHARGYREIRRVNSQKIQAWGDWTTELWNTTSVSVAAVRDAQTLPFLHPLDDGPLHAFRMNDMQGAPVGWVVLLATDMHDGHFGSLRVGTIVDAVSRPGWESAVLREATRLLFDLQAELCVANYTHAQWIAAFRHNGYFPGPSNYIVAASPPLAKAWQALDPQEQQIFFTRADGDGRIHL